MRITLVISRLVTGGAERVISTMANYWATHHQDVTLITISSQETDCYALSARVKRIGLNLEVSSKHLAEAARHNAKRLKRLRREIGASRPDVVISFGDESNVLTLSASSGLGVPVIVSERVDARQHPIGWIWGGLRYMLYRRAYAVVVQSHALRDWAMGLVGQEAVHVIPNPVETPLNGTDRAFRPASAGRTIVAMGRLTRQKGFDLLLRAFGQCAVKHHGWSLIILGEGDKRPCLETLIVELGLKDRVSMPGRVQNPAPILHEADLFVMSSRYEGFPNALLEAMASGLPVISTDCPCGPREIIRDGVDGVLVPPNNADALASAMDRLMEDREERERLGARAVDVTERFGVERVMGMWDQLLTDTCRMRNT
jgi:GalNAc-alpha-(1->4)-GalNAc-alpha-(1->3)-diNAcBac-PP-undecaprenol alpha-1,4-N-acetyl-D-galactosaminyltransferase